MGLWSQAMLPDVVCELACAEVETSKRWQPAAIHDQADQAETLGNISKHSGTQAELFPDVPSPLSGGLRIETAVRARRPTLSLVTSQRLQQL